MNEFIIRLKTSILLIICLYISTYSSIFLFLILLFGLNQMIFEFYNLFSKIFKNKKKLFFISQFVIILLTTYLITFVWLSLSSENTPQKIIFFFIITVTISTDIGGYCFGKIFKGKKITKLSPKKTYSGMIGSYLFSILFSFLIFKSFMSINEIIILSVILSLFSQLGDLLVSFIKRMAKVKDTGNLLPGHGGLLDRFDGLILALPIGSILYKII